jgi:hypothetical protein
MPRQGDGSSDNGPFEEASHDIVHGAGSNKVHTKSTCMETLVNCDT